MPNPWFRLYSEFANDPKVQTMSEEMQRRLIMLFCERCQEVTFSERHRAFYWRVSDAAVTETKRLFIESGFIDEHWNLLNWTKRQMPSDSSTERTRRYRERKRTSQERHGDALDKNRVDKNREEDKKPLQRGTRLPEDFSPDDSDKATAVSLKVDLGYEFEKFRDYFIAAPGQKGVKTNWHSTLKNWLRTAAERGSKNPLSNGHHPVNPDRYKREPLF